MADELPMIYASCVQIYSILLTFPSVKSRRPLVVAFLALYSSAVTAVYLYIRNPLIHEVSYGLLVAISIYVPIRQIYWFKGIHPERFSGMAKLFGTSVVCYLTGFLVWNVENQTCDHVRSLRSDVGYPYRVAFELHAWWHFFTAVGCYGGALLTCYARLLAIGRTDVELKWFGLPYLSTALSWEEIRKANEKGLKYKRE
ncbi:Alkaline ceramidase 3 [Dinochytrium kinnereticum]|nr:Alkaline ceramidase 3 [Dinochytrium kinnereticum]